MMEAVGSKIVSEMTKKTVTEFSFRKSKQVKPMKSVKCIIFESNYIIIEPSILSKRLLLCAQTTAFDLKEVVLLRALPYPASLFDKCGHVRESGKSQLAMYIREQYGKATIVFDGYEDKLSTKSEAHRKRSGGFERTEGQSLPSMAITMKKDIFLSNEENKQSFIIYLCNKLEAAGYVTVYDIKQIRQKLGEEVCSHILFAHAIIGCETTSKPFGFGKSDTMKFVGKTEEEIQAAGHAAMVSLYSGRTGETLDEIRHRMFKLKATKSIRVKPEVLPPTKDVSALHSLRVYHQVQQWMGTDMDPLSCGWEFHHGRLAPTKMREAPAPDHLMKFVKCGCTTTQCSTRQY
ncbi:hypothetical protein PR048_029169, partial [Dryococelus australis]